jgi:hypothetical protein
MFQNYRKHLCIFATSAKIRAVLHVYRGSMNTGNKAMKILIIMFEFAMYSLELEIK